MGGLVYQPSTYLYPWGAGLILVGILMALAAVFWCVNHDWGQS
jgi:hypothetical protein